MPYARIATCCYCGTQAALPSRPVPGRIACDTCGAPLRRLGRAEPAPPQNISVLHRVVPHPAALHPAVPPRVKTKQPKRRKPVLARLWDAAEDMFEDVIDDIFD